MTRSDFAPFKKPSLTQIAQSSFSSNRCGGSHLLGAYFVPGTMLGILHVILFSFQNSGNYYFYFIDRKTGTEN